MLDGDFFFFFFLILAVLDFHCSALASLVVAHGFSCSTVCGVLVSPPGTESASLALKGGFSTPGPAGKSLEG